MQARAGSFFEKTEIQDPILSQKISRTGVNGIVCFVLEVNKMTGSHRGKKNPGPKKSPPPTSIKIKRSLPESLLFFGWLYNDKPFSFCYQLYNAWLNTCDCHNVLTDKKSAIHQLSSKACNLAITFRTTWTWPKTCFLSHKKTSLPQIATKSKQDHKASWPETNSKGSPVHSCQSFVAHRINWIRRSLIERCTIH